MGAFVGERATIRSTSRDVMPDATPLTCQSPGRRSEGLNVAPGALARHSCLVLSSIQHQASSLQNASSLKPPASRIYVAHPFRGEAFRLSFPTSESIPLALSSIQHQASSLQNASSLKPPASRIYVARPFRGEAFRLSFSPSELRFLLPSPASSIKPPASRTHPASSLQPPERVAPSLQGGISTARLAEDLNVAPGTSARQCLPFPCAVILPALTKEGSGNVPPLLFCAKRRDTQPKDLSSLASAEWLL